MLCSTAKKMDDHNDLYPRLFESVLSSLNIINLHYKPKHAVAAQSSLCDAAYVFAT